MDRFMAELMTRRPGGGARWTPPWPYTCSVVPLPGYPPTTPLPYMVVRMPGPRLHVTGTSSPGFFSLQPVSHKTPILAILGKTVKYHKFMVFPVFLSFTESRVLLTFRCFTDISVNFTEKSRKCHISVFFTEKSRKCSHRGPFWPLLSLFLLFLLIIYWFSRFYCGPHRG